MLVDVLAEKHYPQPELSFHFYQLKQSLAKALNTPNSNGDPMLCQRPA